MKRSVYWFATLICVLLITISGCDVSWNDSTFHHTFRQSQSNVAQIEICICDEQFPAGNATPLVLLDDTDVGPFWTDIEHLECRETKKFDTPTGYGDIIFLVTYQNGEKEIFSFQWIGYISADGTHHESLRYFDPIDICNVFAKYADPALLADQSDFFQNYWNILAED